jgi:hypothetical protein
MTRCIPQTVTASKFIVFRFICTYYDAIFPLIRNSTISDSNTHRKLTTLPPSPPNIFTIPELTSTPAPTLPPDTPPLSGAAPSVTEKINVDILDAANNVKDSSSKDLPTVKGTVGPLVDKSLKEFESAEVLTRYGRPIAMYHIY